MPCGIIFLITNKNYRNEDTATVSQWRTAGVRGTTPSGVGELWGKFVTNYELTEKSATSKTVIASRMSKSPPLYSIC